MLIIDGKQYLEGIDSIDLLIRQLWYDSIDLSKKPDPRNLISLYVTKGSFAVSETNFHNKYFIYLHISGEYINPELRTTN
jgi:hypothetical protein